jgi:ribosomal protein L37AE/L43A
MRSEAMKKRDIPPPTREPKDGACENCKKQHPVLEWDGGSWLCPPCWRQLEADAYHHALTGDWR